MHIKELLHMVTATSAHGYYTLHIVIAHTFALYRCYVSFML